MSYILDALRRANAERERERGTVPSLHTQQYGALPGDEDEPPRRSRATTALVILLAAGLLAVLAWHFLGSDRAPPVVAQAALPAPLPVTPSPVSIAPVTPAPQPMAMAGTPVPPAASSAAATVPAKPAVRQPKPARAATPPATTAAEPNTAASSAASRIYAIAELPDDVRRDLPKLAFNGASYSSDAASRMVIVNGQVFHEGDTIARGLVLQRVNRKSAVLAFRGYRYELGF